MNCPSQVSTVLPSERITAISGRLGNRSAFLLLASLTVSFLAGSIAPTPLYPLYQARWGFSAAATSVVFGVYALAVLVSLLTLGRVSDSIGRRPVLLAATAGQVLSMLLFVAAQGLDDLLIARVVQGIATGAALSAIGAGLIDFDRTRGATANAITPPLGSASGGLLAGLVVQFLPAPTQLIYQLLALVFVLQLVGIALMPETVRTRALRWNALLPRFGLPPAVRATVGTTFPALVATWALAGFYGALGPAMVRGLLATSSPLLSGVAVFLMAGSAGAAIALLRQRDPRTMLVYGALALVAGMALTLAGLSWRVPVLFFLGTALAGSGFGSGFQGALRTVVAETTPADRSEALALVFVVAYLAMGLPVMAAGWLVSHHGGIQATTLAFGALEILLATGSLWSLRQSSTSSPSSGNSTEV